MTRILLVGPLSGGTDGGSLPPYLDVLTAALRRAGAHVERVGSTGIPYDRDLDAIWSPSRLLLAAGTLADRIDALVATQPIDVIALHFGNLEIEQLLPVLWARRNQSASWPAVVIHVHTLMPTLFADHHPDPSMQRAVHAAPAAADGLVYFGDYARQAFASMVPADMPITVAPLPTTIPPGTLPAQEGAVADAVTNLSAYPGPLATLYGYAAPWKAPRLLIEALSRVRRPLRVLLAGPLWDQPELAGVRLPQPGHASIVGVSRLQIAPTYLAPADRSLLVASSTLAVFPYVAHRAFQGSGAIADYLAHAVPVVATDVANMASLVSLAGDIVAPEDPDRLAAALNRYTNPEHLTRRASAAADRANTFHPDTHAATCLALYARAAARRRSKARRWT